MSDPGREEILRKIVQEAVIWRDEAAPKLDRSRARQRFSRALRKAASDPLELLHLHMAAVAVADAHILTRT